MKNVKVLGDRLLVKVEVPKKETESGIILTTETQEHPDIATVMAVGGGKRLDDGTFAPMPMKAGDTVRFFPLAGMDMLIEGELCKVLNESDIVAVIEN